MRFLISMTFCLLLSSTAQAQCPFTPTVTGNINICPQSATTLSTQNYSAYQWYTRPFGSNTATPVNGATGANFTVDYNQTPVYVSVAATLNNCTERSAEVLVDGIIFLPLVVRSEGQFSTGPNGESVFCPGDTMFLIALQPYTLNFQWYDGNSPIPGANDDTLVVTRPGSYWLRASPGLCPNITATLGVVIDVVWGAPPACATSVRDIQPIAASITPNPADNIVEIQMAEYGLFELKMADINGRPVKRQVFEHRLLLNLDDMPAGVYTLIINKTNGTGIAIRKLIIQKP